MHTDSWAMPVCIPDALDPSDSEHFEMDPPTPSPSDGVPYVGGEPPYGFVLNATTRMLLPDDGEQAVIAEAVRLHGRGLSLRGVSRELALAGMVSRTGAPFAASQVSRLVVGPPPHVPATRRQRAIATALYRASAYGVARERVDPVAVFVRDHWRCRICGRETPKERMGNPAALDAPTVDHIIPMSRGGPHTYANVRCACHSCNSGKRQPKLVRV